MHPAVSVIFFTVASGAGYGVLAFTGILAAAGRMPSYPLYAVINLGIGLTLVTAGLLSSTAHLGHPERAWRAITQWRSSWLSREGVFALLTYAPALVLAWLWIVEQRNDGAIWIATGLTLTLLSVVTVLSTAMIYRSLKPIPAWHNGWTMPVYLALGLASGAVVLSAALAALGRPLMELQIAALVLTAVGLVLKLGYWQALDRGFGGPNRGDATGLGGLGTVHPFENPHSADNYLMKEMGYRIARKHAAKLRVYAIVLGFALPLAGLLAGALFIENSWVPVISNSIAGVVMLVGLLVERWLFFAEARHVVTQYYRDPEVLA